MKGRKQDMVNVSAIFITIYILFINTAESGNKMNWGNTLSIVISVAAFFVSIVVALIDIKAADSSIKNQTIDQYRRLSDKKIKGPFYWLYHMDKDELDEIIRIAAHLDHDELRKSTHADFKKFKVIEDNLGEIDEFASGIINNLYNYKTFKALAFNYCRKRVVPPIDDLLSCYENKNSYKNLRYLILRMKIEYHTLEKMELPEYRNKLMESEKRLQNLDKSQEEYIEEKKKYDKYKERIEKYEKSTDRKNIREEKKELKKAYKRCR